MATKATHITNPVVFHVSSTLLGRVGLQAVGAGTKPPSIPRPVAVSRPSLPHRASFTDYTP